MSQGLLEALTGVIGEEDTDIGGLFSTRLTTAVAAGDTTFLVEGTSGWATAGKLSVGGVVYSYTGKTITSFTGITHNDNGTPVSGAYADHRVASEVIDLSRNRSAMDKLRRAMLTEYAEAEDLSMVGRNLGVMRLPFLNDDDRFRKVIQAIAYNPRGTLYGLELALTGLVDAGNFEVFEDLLNFPCTVFIRLSGAAAADDVRAGKAFLNAGVHRLALSDTTTDVPASPAILAVQSVRWKDEDFVTDCRTAKPSAHSVIEYDGDPGTDIWTYDGGTGGLEATGIVVNASGWCDFLDTAAAAFASYKRYQRIRPESRGSWGMTFAVDSVGTMSAVATSGNQWRQCVRDGERAIAWGCIQDTGSTFNIGFIDISTGSFLSGAAATLQKDTFYTVQVQKNERADLELVVDGAVKQVLAHSVFPASADHLADFGCLDSALSGMLVKLKHVQNFITTLTDYWAARGAGGTLSNPTTLDVGVAGVFGVEDVGRSVRILNTTTLNAQGGLNQGRFKVLTRVTDQQVTLEGDTPLTTAQVSTGTPVRITIPDDAAAFRYPDHLGRKIVISGSGAGNNGTYVIDKILDPVSFVDMGSWLSHPPESSNVCEVVAAAFATESGLTWKMEPDFAAETPVDWEMADAGSVGGTTLTFPQALPITTGGYDRVLTVRYTDVLSGQVVEDESVSNAAIDLVPNYEFYPFYVSDPLGYARSYLDAITAAGVIPDFQLV